MASFMADRRRRRSQTYKKIFTLVVMAIAIMMIYSTSIPIITRPLVEAQLASFTNYIATHARQEHGMDANFSYGDISIDGLGRSATIHNPALLLSDSSFLGQGKTEIKTEEIVIKSVGDSAYAVFFPKPFTIIDQSQRNTRLAFDGVPTYQFHPENADGQTVWAHSITLPPKFTLAANLPLEQAMKEPVTTVTYAPDHTFLLKQYADGRNETTIAFRDINASVSNEPLSLSIGSLSTVASRGIAAEGKYPFDSSVTLADVGIKRGDVLDGPYNFKLGMNGVSAPADETGTIRDMDMNLREFALYSDKFRVGATGSISRKPDDSLPFGQINVTVTNYPALRDTPAIGPEIKAAMDDVVARVSGPQPAAGADIAFAIKRDKLGTLAIGQASLEDITAIFITRLLLNRNSEQGAPVMLTPEPPAPPAVQ